VRSFKFISILLILVIVSCEKKTDIDNTITDYRDKIAGRYICTGTYYEYRQGETHFYDIRDTIMVLKDSLSNQIIIGLNRYYIGIDYFFTEDQDLSHNWDDFFDHGQFYIGDTIKIIYVFNQIHSPGGNSSTTLKGFKEE